MVKRMSIPAFSAFVQRVAEELELDPIAIEHASFADGTLDSLAILEIFILAEETFDLPLELSDLAQATSVDSLYQVYCAKAAEAHTTDG